MNPLLDLFDQYERSPEIEAAILGMAGHCETGRGAVFTRPEVVTAILDLSGYRADQPLHRMRLLEPSFGGGDFLFPAIQRLWEAYVANGGTSADASHCLRDAVRAVELHPETFEGTLRRLLDLLASCGMSGADARALCSSWLVRDDFLLTRLEGHFDFVIGNPPYVRQERIPTALLSEYRRRFKTLYDRADLYVPFFERALDLLGDDGTLGYICANRWLKNRYGGPLRAKIAQGYWLKYFIDLESADVFHSDVIAYPAITVLQRVSAGQPSSRTTRAVSAASADATSLPRLVDALRENGDHSGTVEEIDLTGSGSGPLLLDDIPRLALLRRIEREFPALEEAGCKVGIGVATGCDKVFIGDMQALPVEAERKLPLVMARDLVEGEIRWGGKAVLNPFEDWGQLVPLKKYPRFAAYLQAHHASVAGRNVARRSPASWYRTIDRIYPELQKTPKLLVPDIKGKGVFVLDEGRYYPHHNLYFITSREWDLQALQTVLRSSFTLMTVATYCTRMAGGFLRFQAQYLRRIRIPHWHEVESGMRARLKAAASTAVQEEIDLPVFELFGLTAAEAKLVLEIAISARVGKETDQ